MKLSVDEWSLGSYLLRESKLVLHLIYSGMWELKTSGLKTRSGPSVYPLGHLFSGSFASVKLKKSGMTRVWNNL